MHTDACGSSLRAILYQTCDYGTDVIISYVSQSLSEAKVHYPTKKLEFLTLKWDVVEKFLKYLYGSTCDVYTQ